jgi:plastocyanin
MENRKNILIIAFVFALASITPAVLAGGGGAPSTTQVSIAGFAFSSNNVTINIADSVEWTNQDSTTHTVTDTGGPESYDSGDMANGNTFTFTFNIPGDYPYACNKHPSTMTGVVHVIDPGAGSGENNSGNETGDNGTSNVTMMIWMPDGTPLLTSFDIDNTSNAWQASVIGFNALGMSYNADDTDPQAVFLISIGGLFSDVSFGDPAYWYWSLYLMNASGGYVESPVGVSSVNVSDGMNFAWVATNGSWGPMEGSVQEMLEGLNSPVSGCMDVDATNFNPEATVDDDSCTYESGGNETAGCTNSAAMNYMAEADVDDGSCLYDDDGDGVANGDEIDGCTDSAATNYNLAATDMDDSCTYDTDGDGVLDGDEIVGCTNDSAENFSPTATDDDGTCTFADPTDNGTDNATGEDPINDGTGDGTPSGGDNSGGEGTTTPPEDKEAETDNPLDALATAVPGGMVGVGAIGGIALLTVGYLIFGRK